MANKEELKRLAEIAEKDKEFAEKFIAAEKAKDADEIIRLAAEKGVTLKRENFAERHEIDNEELKNVAGGSEKLCTSIPAMIACGAAFGIDFWGPNTH